MCSSLQHLPFRDIPTNMISDLLSYILLTLLLFILKALAKEKRWMEVAGQSFLPLEREPTSSCQAFGLKFPQRNEVSSMC